MESHLHSIAGEGDKRPSSRESVRFTATINYGETSVSCIVRDMSSTGASVLLTDGRDVPDDVTLSIVGKPIRYRARVVWRLSRLIALKFR